MMSARALVFDYTRKRGVLYAEILTPPNTPAWMEDRAQLWNAVEKAEKRKDAQLARDLLLSLPHELTPEQRRDLVREFDQHGICGAGHDRGCRDPCARPARRRAQPSCPCPADDARTGSATASAKK